MGSSLCKCLFQKRIPNTWGRRECREACRPLLNNFRMNRALLSNFMFLDPSHRNELVSISGNLGAKGKISADSEQNSTFPSVSRKENAILASSWESFTLCRPPQPSHSQSWYLAYTGSSHWDGWIPNSPGPRIYLLLSRSPSRVKGQGAASEWEDHPAPHCPR